MKKKYRLQQLLGIFHSQSVYTLYQRSGGNVQITYNKEDSFYNCTYSTTEFLMCVCV